MKRASEISRQRNDVNVNVVILAYSKSAVLEMKSRLNSNIGQTGSIRVMTFHSLAFNICKSHYQTLGFTSIPKVCTQSQGLIILKESVKVLASDIFNGCLENDREERSLEKLLKLFHFAKTVCDPLKYLATYGDQTTSGRTKGGQETTPLGQLFLVYQAQLRKENVIELGDMIPLANSLFELYATLGSMQSIPEAAMDHCLVDEYQDLNAVQVQMLLHMRPQGAVTVVGDCDQMIYSFQGADQQNFARFISHYESRAAPVCQLSLR